MMDGDGVVMVMVGARHGEFQVIFFLMLGAVVCCVAPCIAGWRSLSESTMVKLFTSTLAMTIFQVSCSVSPKYRYLSKYLVCMYVYVCIDSTTASRGVM